MTDASFAVSTYLFHQERLDREHLVDIAAHGFGAVELFARRSHFDCADPLAVERLGEWLDDTRLALTSVHAPIAESLDDRGGDRPCSIASANPTEREHAVAIAMQALDLAKVLPYRHFVVHVGVPDALSAAHDNDAPAARQSLDALVAHADACGVQVALEVMPNRLSTPEALVVLVEEVLRTPGAGICLDVGHARLLGDPVDAIETASGHILTTHLHDTHGSRDDHLVPYEGSIDWTRTLLAFQKVGYRGPWTFELAPTAAPLTTLEAASHARQRFAQRLGINDELRSQ